MPRLAMRLLLCLFLIFVHAYALAETLTPTEKQVFQQEEQEFGVDRGKRIKKQETHSEESRETLPDYQSTLEPEKIKPIEAEDFQVRIRKKSSSGRVLLFEDPTENRPRPGKILLIKRDADEIGAVRVLKLYPTDQANKTGARFAAKIVLPIQEFSTDTEYRALKKLGDKIIQMIKAHETNEANQRRTDEELAREVEPDDAELDRGIPKPPEKPATPLEPPTEPLQDGKKSGSTDTKEVKASPLFDKTGNEIDATENLEVSEEDEPYDDLSPSENKPYDPSRHVITAQYASIKGFFSNGAPTSYSAFGVRYGFNLFHPLFLKRRTVQDMLTLEVGGFYYTIDGYLKSDDRLTVIPVIGTVRYTLLPSETFNFYVYAGAAYSTVNQTEGKTTVEGKELARLQQTTLAVGAGLMIKLGPGWAARVDYGRDLIGVGAVLKF